MLCVEDALDGLRWAERLGGAPALIARGEANLAAIAAWVANSDWARFLAHDPATRSCTSVCLRIVDPWFTGLDAGRQAATAKAVAELLDTEGVARDINGYRDAPPGLRIWAGATIEKSDVEALLPWLDWAYATVKAAPA
jgi:phosphoserine aminotransferase